MVIIMQEMVVTEVVLLNLYKGTRLKLPLLLYYYSWYVFILCIYTTLFVCLFVCLFVFDRFCVLMLLLLLLLNRDRGIDISLH